jgi:putative transposase
MRELAALSILRDSQFYGVKLHAFVVMHHHLHLLMTCPEGRTASWLVQRLKSNLAKVALPLLMPEERSLLGVQQGLNQRTFWKPSFRGLEVSTTDTFFQKTQYIHLNPVRANLANEAASYRWSSQRLWGQDFWSLEHGLDLPQAIAAFDETLETRVSESR